MIGPNCRHVPTAGGQQVDPHTWEGAPVHRRMCTKHIFSREHTHQIDTQPWHAFAAVHCAWDATHRGPARCCMWPGTSQVCDGHANDSRDSRRSLRLGRAWKQSMSERTADLVAWLRSDASVPIGAAGSVGACVLTRTCVTDRRSAQRCIADRAGKRSTRNLYTGHGLPSRTSARCCKCHCCPNLVEGEVRRTAEGFGTA